MNESLLFFIIVILIPFLIIITTLFVCFRSRVEDINEITKIRKIKEYDLRRGNVDRCQQK